MTGWLSRIQLHNVNKLPVFAPSRIAVASGLQPVRLGALGNNNFLPRTATTYYQRLRDHNYYVGCVGKLDLAKPDGYNGRDGDRPATYMWGFTHPVEVEGKSHAGRGRIPQGPYNHFLKEKGLLDAFVDDYSAECPKQVMIRFWPTEAFQIRTSDSDLYSGSKTYQTISSGIYL